jgi:hypothetical protein
MEKDTGLKGGFMEYKWSCNSVSSSTAGAARRIYTCATPDCISI